MNKSIVSDNKKKIGRPKVGSVFVGTRVPPDFMAEIDDWCSKQRPIPSRPEALRQLTATGLAVTPVIAELLDYFQSIPPDPKLDSTINKLRGIFD